MNIPQHARGRAATIVIVVLFLSILYTTSLYSYLLFHSLAELFSIAVAAGVFMLAWNSRRYLDNNYLLFIGIGYLFIAFVDLLHTLAYQGMGVFRDPGANLATQLWLAARYLQSGTLLVGLLFVKRRFDPRLAWVGFMAVTIALVGSIFVWDFFPAAYIDGQGLTSFKIVSEYFISAGLVAATALLLTERRAFDRQVLYLLAMSLVVTVLSELMFTLYIGVYDNANLIGHLLKIVAVYFVYRAIVQTGLIRPYSVMFRNLKHAEQRYRYLFDEAPVMYVTLNNRANGSVITGCNDLFLETLGYERDEVIGQPLANFYAPLSRDILIEDGRGEVPDGGPHQQERQLVTKNGEIVCTLLHFSAERSADGTRAEILAAYTNITERKRAEQAEREQRHLAEALTDVSAALNSSLELDVVLNRILSNVGHVVPHDAANIMLLDGDVARVVRHQGYEAEARDHIEHVTFKLSETPVLRRIVESGEPSILPDVALEPAWIDAPSAAKIRSYAAAPISYQGRVIGFVNLDSDTPNSFTERDARRLLAFASSAATALRNAQLYREAQEARQQAERADQTKLRFLGMVSHELRTPLTSIQGFASTLLAPDVEWTPEDQRDFLETINSEADRLGELIDQLLDLSRIESGRLSVEMRYEQLQQALVENSSRLTMLASQHLVNMSIPNDLPPVRADIRRVLQVLTNLVGNAAKYSPAGTVITIAAEENSHAVVVSVSDEGPGIPSDQRDSIFEPFTRLRESLNSDLKGSGLGLAICRGIVEAHGGHIWVEERNEPGTTVSFSLPVNE